MQGNVSRKLPVMLSPTKMSFFFSYTNSENRRAEQGKLGGVGTSGRWEGVGKGV
jgi:hypothetical protein